MACRYPGSSIRFVVRVLVPSLPKFVLVIAQGPRHLRRRPARARTCELRTLNTDEIALGSDYRT
eukprot:scaffold28905_cov47-Prasinocladus_malaysianus.AAC.1